MQDLLPAMFQFTTETVKVGRCAKSRVLRDRVTLAVVRIRLDAHAPAFRARRSDSMPITFHPEAAKRFDDLGNEVRGFVCEVDEPNRPQKDYHLYPAAKLGPQDIKEVLSFFNSVQDDRGNEVGRTWKDQDRWFGLLGTGYQQMRDLAARLEKTSDLHGRVGTDFLLSKIVTWLRDSKSGSLTEYLVTCCQEVIKDQEIWIPLFRVYCASQFSIGAVTFRSISEQIMTAFFDPQGRRPSTEAERQHRDKLRSKLQGTLAACVKVTAEAKMAQQIARSVAGDSIALLRFLSPANLTPGSRSYCLPLGREEVEIGTELLVSNDRIQTISQVSLECGPIGSDLDEAVSYHAKTLAHLHALASDRKTEFRQQLYDALLLYSRNSVTSDVAEKLVFVLVAIESMLLKDANEPIAKNIGERMAFLIGDTLDARKAIVKSVDQAYGLRSAFIHHGYSIDDVEIVGRFLVHAWETFRSLLYRIDRTASKMSLIQELEERKLK